MKLTLLGTAATFPTKERNHSAVHLQYGGEGLLFDCGEGTQRQIRIAGINPMKITKVFITHWHGDHVLGLAGLLQSLSMNQKPTDLYLYGPKGTKERLSYMFRTYEFRTTFDVKVKEYDSDKVGVIDEGEGYKVYAVRLDHAVPCIGFAFEEDPKIKINMEYVGKFGVTDHDLIENLRKGKDITWKKNKISAKTGTYSLPGKKFSYIVDTAPSEKVVELAKNSNVLVCEGTFLDELKEKSQDYGHLTAKQAAKLAKKAEVKKLVLTHFSQRYKDVKPLLDEAKEVFKETVIGEDFMEMVVK